MKRNGLFLGILFSAMLFLTASCGRDADDTTIDDDMTYDERDDMIQDQTMDRTADNEFWTVDRDYTFNEREDFRNEVNSSIERLDSRINELETHAANATGDTKDWYNDRIEDLKEHRNEIQEDLQEFDTVAEDNWDNFRSDIASTWNDLEDSWDEIAQDDRMKEDGMY